MSARSTGWCRPARTWTTDRPRIELVPDAQSGGDLPGGCAGASRRSWSRTTRATCSCGRSRAVPRPPCRSTSWSWTTARPMDRSKRCGPPSPQPRSSRPATNLGFAAAVNLGAAETPGADILLVNPDARLAPTAVAELLACAAARPDLGVYGASVLLEDGSTDPGFAKQLPTPWSLFCFATGLSTIARGSRTFDPESLASRPPTEVTSVGMVSGCVVLISAPAWQRLGGFDERFFMYAEDADLSFRAREAGFDPVVVPAAVAHHVSGGTSTSARRQVLMLAGRTTYIRTHWSPAARTIGLGLLGAGVGLRALGSTLLGARRGQGERNRWVHAWRERASWWAGYAPSRRRSPLVPAAEVPTGDAHDSGAIGPSPVRHQPVRHQPVRHQPVRQGRKGSHEDRRVRPRLRGFGHRGVPRIRGTRGGRGRRRHHQDDGDQRRREPGHRAGHRRADRRGGGERPLAATTNAEEALEGRRAVARLRRHPIAGERQPRDRLRHGGGRADRRMARRSGHVPHRGVPLHPAPGHRRLRADPGPPPGQRARARRRLRRRGLPRVPPGGHGGT